jgi:hypothetical protein
MPKLPDDADMNRIWALPLNQRVPALVISVIESCGPDARAIARTFCSIVVSMARMQSAPSRGVLADVLRAAAEEIESTVIVQHE